ncbi:portal protein [Variovorax atrisoli]|uniref:portal protein n=1 Tax=Variovorax atrisoli TaxID=3394203 RepID=UPI00036F6666|nr:portal protein [Variovorax paradoxus]
MTEAADQLDRRYTQLAAQRLPHETIWQEVFEYLAPERAVGWYSSPTESAGTTAANQRAVLYDSTAIDAGEVLKSNFASWMTPDNSRWFGLDAGQDDEQTTAWMDGAAQFLFEHINSAGFGAVAGECYSDIVPAGWFVLYIDEGKDEQGRPIGGYNFEQWPLSQCFVASSKPAGRVDTIYRCFDMTVEQAVAEYGLDKVSDETAKLFNDGKLTEKVPMLWAIEPRRKGEYGAALSKNLPFRSCHMEKRKKHIVRESGYHEFPCAVPRWRLIPGTPYATGLGSNVLPDVKTLNQIKKLELMSLDIAVGGMWKAVDDGVLNPKTIRIGPRKIVAMASLESMAPLETGANFNVSFSKCQDLQQGIRRALLADMLTPQGGPVRSATEIARDMNQIRQLMAPLVGRFQSEFLQVTVERCFNIAYRAGALVAKLGPVPEGLLEGDYTVKYISPLARSQLMEEVTAIDTFVAGLLALAGSTQDMTVLDNIKLDDANYEKGKALGVPAKLLRGPEELAEKREMDNRNRQQAQQDQQAQALQMKAGETAIDAAVAA